MDSHIHRARWVYCVLILHVTSPRQLPVAVCGLILLVPYPFFVGSFGALSFHSRCWELLKLLFIYIYLFITFGRKPGKSQ